VPSQQEINNYFSALRAGSLTIEDLRGDFVGSSEYFFLMTKGDADDATWVRSAYLDILGRAATDHEVNDIWVPILEQAQF
jgi:hypothetical protein